ncbi:MAG: hypothetical protein Q9M20_01625 [Mariprofundaceae bacterium]|nr:hypothetical protein [Mariprofundaceae bacterium]
MKKRMIFGLWALLISSVAMAEDKTNESAKHALALIAPEGRWVVQVEVRRSSFDKRFNPFKKEENLGASFDAIDLNSNIFPALALLGPSATLGTTTLNTDVVSDRTRITLGYGLTEDISIGTILEYVRNQSHVNFSVAGGNVGFNPLFNANAAIGPTNFPFAPAGGAINPVGTEGVQNILTSPVFGYGYKRIGSVTTSGAGDPVFGGLWRALKDDKQSIVLGAAYRAGIAKADNPDDLFDVVVADGSNDIFMQFEYFRDLGAGFDLHLKTVRTWQFEDTRTMRVPAPGEVLAVSASKEELKRNLGDYWEHDIELGKVMGNWRLSTTWHRYAKNSDRYVSKMGNNTVALMANTDIFADQWRVSASWSGIEAWQQGEIPLPLIVRLEVQDTYRGKNMPKAFDSYLLMTTFF